MLGDLQPLLLLLARILVGGAFMTIGIRIVLARGMVSELLAKKNIPFPLFVTLSGAAIEIVLGGLTILGMWLPVVSVVLAIFVLAATIMVHDFWRQTGAQREADLNTALSNLILIGGLLGLAAATL